MTDQEFTPGEIQRSLARLEQSFADLTKEVRERHHSLTDEINAAIGPISMLKVQVEQTKLDIATNKVEIARIDGKVDDVDDRVDAVTQRVAWIVGVGVGASFMIAKFWK